MKAKNEVHYFEVKDVIQQFASAFDSIIIGRFDRERKLKNSLRVRYLYAPKQRVLHNLVNKAEHITIPAVSIWMTGMERDTSRVFNKNQGHFLKRNNNEGIDHIPQPVPVNISVSMSIITRYQTDMDQILANFIPYTDPYIIISWKLPKEFSPVETEIRSEVLWSGSISLNTPKEMGADDKFRITADTSFTIKAWLFKRHPDDPEGIIYNIDSTYYPVRNFGKLEDLDVFDQQTLSGHPQTTFTSRNWFPVGQENIYKVEGYMFDFLDSVYLSTDNPNMLSSVEFSAFNNFEGDMETVFPAFTATPIHNFDIINKNVLYVTLPEFSEQGKIRLILENLAGYGIDKELQIT